MVVSDEEGGVRGLLWLGERQCGWMGLMKGMRGLMHMWYDVKMFYVQSSYGTMLYIPTVIHLAYIYEFLPQSSRYFVRYLLAQQRLVRRFYGVHGVP